MYLLFISPATPCSTNGPSTLKWTYISFSRKLPSVTFGFYMFHPPFSMLTSSAKVFPASCSSISGPVWASDHLLLQLRGTISEYYVNIIIVECEYCICSIDLPLIIGILLFWCIYIFSYQWEETHKFIPIFMVSELWSLSPLLSFSGVI